MADDYDRYRLRMDALADLRRIVEGLGRGDEHIIPMSAYEVVNLREALQATGYATVYRSPLMALQSGDWLGQIWQKLPYLDGIKPNLTVEEYARRAREWHRTNPDATA